MWPGVWSASKVKPAPAMTSPSAVTTSGTKSRSPDPSPSSDSGSSSASIALRTLSSWARMASAGCGPKPCVGAPVASFSAAAAGEWSGWVWVISR